MNRQRREHEGQRQYVQCSPTALPIDSNATHRLRACPAPYQSIDASPDLGGDRPKRVRDRHSSSESIRRAVRYRGQRRGLREGVGINDYSPDFDTPSSRIVGDCGRESVVDYFAYRSSRE